MGTLDWGFARLRSCGGSGPGEGRFGADYWRLASCISGTPAQRDLISDGTMPSRGVRSCGGSLLLEGVGQREVGHRHVRPGQAVSLGLGAQRGARHLGAPDRGVRVRGASPARRGASGAGPVYRGGDRRGGSGFLRYPRDSRWRFPAQSATTDEPRRSDPLRGAPGSGRRQAADESNAHFIVT